MDSPKPLGVVAVDVDETVADLLGEWLRRYNEKSGDALLPEDLRDWDIKPRLRDGWQDGEAFYDILYESDIYRHVLPIQGARTAVRRLKAAGYRVVFASSCSHGTEHHKAAWLRRYGFIESDKDFIGAQDKSLVRADILCDDGPHNIAAFKGRKFLITQPHNLLCDPIPGFVRVPHLGAAVDIILSENFTLGF